MTALSSDAKPDSVARVGRYQDTNFITGMRAWAAFGVFLTHSGAGGLAQQGWLGAQIVDLGRFGVEVFFVIAGFSVVTSYTACPDWRSYLIQRLLRVVPLYWCAIAMVFSAHHWAGLPIPAEGWMSYFGASPDAANFFLHLSFLSIFDYKIANSIIGVEWTLPVEVFYYLLIPCVLMCGYPSIARKRYHTAAIRIALLLLAVWGVFSVFEAPLERQEHGSIAERWHPLTHIWAFALGVLAFYLRPYAKLYPAGCRFGRILAFGLVMLALLLAKKQDVFLEVATFLLIVCAADQHRGIRALFCNRIALYVGIISYSFYLLHMPVIHWLPAITKASDAHAFPYLLLISLIASTVTYTVIERPTRILGRRWARQRLVSREPLTA